RHYRHGKGPCADGGPDGETASGTIRRFVVNTECPLEQWFAEQNEFLIFVFLFLTLVLIAEVGHRIAGWVRASHAGTAIEIQSIQGAVLGLLALLLGFTFAMAAERFQARKD